MADFQSEWKFNVDTSDAVAAIKNLQRQISAFHQAMQQSGSAANAAASANAQKNLLNSINATGKFAATMTNVKTETEAFTNALEKNKFSMGQYFRYAGASTKTFGRLFTSEFNTIEKVARERVKTLQTQYIKMGRDAGGAMQAMSVRPLVLDMQNLGTQVMMTAQKQQIFNQLLQQGSTNLLNFGKNTQWAGRQLMVGFTIPLSIMGTAAIREFQKIEEQVVKFRRVYGDAFSIEGDTEKALDNIRALADEFTKYGIAVEKTIGLAATVAQMGNVGADLTNQVTEATRLAVLGGIEQEEALNTTISLTSAFGTATEDLANKIDFLNAVENQTILSIEDFNEAIPKAGAVVKQLGGDVEDLAFFLTAMREGGINASESANALKSGLASLINPTEKSAQFLQEFGINVRGIVEANKGDIKGIVVGFAQALDELDPLNRARAIEQLFGKFQFARISTLFQNVIKQGSQAQQVLKLTQQSSAELQVLAERELKRVEESPAFRLQKQLESLKASLAPVGEEFIKLLMPLLEFANKVLKSFNSMEDGAKSFVTGLVAVLGLVAPVALMTFGLVANGVANVVKGFNVYRSMLSRLSGVNNSVYTTTQYMTNEHLRATSVAMSLAQSHQFLTTQFTSETAAIDALVAAYQRAIAAQRAFMTVPAIPPARPVINRVGPRRVQSPGGPIPGFADGVFNLAGPRGAGDTIPAMIAPGESVISAEMTQKYAPLIKGIIADNLPGFQNSYMEAVRARPGRSGRLSGAEIEQRMGPAAFSSMVSDLESAKVSTSSALKILQQAASSMKKFGTTADDAAKTIKTAIDNAEKTATGAVKNSKALTEQTRAGFGLEKPSAPTKVFGHIGAGPRMSPQEAERIIQEKGINLENRSYEAIRIAKERGTSVEMKSAYGIDLDPDINRALAKEGASRQTLLDDMSARGVEKFRTAMDLSSQSFDKVRSSLDLYDQQLQQVIAEDNAEKVFDLDVQASEYQSRTGMRAGSMESYNRMARAKQLELGNIEGVTAIDIAASTPTEVATKGVRGARRAKGNQPIAEMVSAYAKEVKAEPLVQPIAQEVSQAVDQSVDAAMQRAKQELEIKSPSERASRELGLPISQGIADGIKDGKPAVDSAINSTVTGAIDSGKTQARRASSKEINFNAGTGSGVLPPTIPTKTAQATPSGIPGNIAAQMGLPQLQTAIGEAMVPPEQAIGRGLKGKLKKVGQGILQSTEKSLMEGFLGKTKYGGILKQTMIDNALSQAKVANKMQDVELVDGSGNVLAASAIGASAAAQTRAGEAGMPAEDLVVDTAGNPVLDGEGRPITKKEALKMQKRQQRRDRAGRVAGGLATVSMITSMAAMAPGQTGEIAQKLMPAVFGLSAVAPLLMALPGPLALLIAVIGAGVGAFFLFNQAMADAKKSAIQTAESLSMSSQKLDKLAEFTGKATASQIAQQERENQIAGEDAKKRQFGQSFVGSEPGQAMLENVRQRLEAGDTNVAQNIADQLAYAVFQGALTRDEAAGIGAALSAELKDFSITAKVTAELTALLGPNGENILTDPLTIALRIQEDSTEQQLASYENAMQEIEDNAALDGGTIGNLIGGGIMTAAGAVMVATGFLAPLGLAIAGAGIGTMVASGINEGMADAVDNAKAAGVAVQLGAEQIAQNQGLLDITNQKYNAQIAELEAKKAAAKTDEEILRLEGEIADKQKEKDAALTSIKEKNKVIYDNLVKQANAMGPAFDDAIGASIDERYKDASGALRASVDLAKESLAGMEQGDFKIGLQLALASGEVDPTAVTNLINAAAKDETLEANYNLLVATEGTAAANQMIQLLLKGGVKTQRFAVIMDYILNDGQDFATDMEALAQITNMGMEYGITIDLNAPGAEKIIGEVSQFMKDTEEMPDVVSYDIITKYMADYPGMDPQTKATLRGILDNWDVLSAGNNEISYDVLVDIGIGKADPAAIMAMYLAANPGKAPKFTGSIDALDRQKSSLIDDATAWFFSLVGQTNANKPGDTQPGPGGTGGAKADPFADILNSLKQLRNWTIDATGGAKELMRVLGEGKNITVFRGMDQLSMIADFGSEFASYLSGLDEETRKLFVEFKKGGPVLTDLGKAMQKAFTEEAIGKFQINVVQSLEALRNQRIAVDKLVKDGVAYGDALKIATNETLALAIATGTIDTAELEQIIKLIEELRAQEKLNTVLDQINEQINDFIETAAAKETIKLKFTPMQQSAILNDETLMAMTKLGQHGSAAFANRLAQIMSTIEFKQSIFDDGFNKAMEAFSAYEQRITLDFDLGTNLSGKNVNLINLTTLRNDAAAAENSIAKLNFQIDDLEAELVNIEGQEETINKKYDKRIEALEKVEDINNRLLQQQKSQLTIANALTQGDIAAAAKAVQEQRAEEAKQFAQQQKDLLEQQREAELTRVISAKGNTREQVEQRIKALKDQIFQIEEQTLEPLNEQIRLAEILIKQAIEQITVLDRSRQAWEAIKNRIDIARVSSVEYAQAMQAALDIVNDIVNYWNGIQSKVVYLDIIERRRQEGDPEPPPPPSPDSTSGRINSSYTVVAEAQAAGNERAKVLDRETAASAAYAAVHGGGLTAGGVTIKAGSTIEFAEKVQEVVLANRAAFQSGNLSAAEKAAITKQNIAIMQAAGLRFAQGGAVPQRLAMGGKVGYYPMGGLIPYKANGGLFKTINTDSVPAMLTPGEFVVRRFAVEKFGTENLKAINNGTYKGDSVYNYSVNVNVKSDANPDQIARAVMTQIKGIDAQRIRGNRF